MTVWREMPAGRGVRVVKTERFDILNGSSNLVDVCMYDKKGRSKECGIES
jgi:hypothetical protein